MPIKVNMISESEFSIQGHGVHTAYFEITKALKKLPEISIKVNDKKSADIIHLQTVGLYALGKIILNYRAKRVITAHLTPDSFIGSLRLAKQWYGLAKFYLKTFYNLADLVIAVSESTKQDLIELGVKKPIVVIENGVDADFYRQIVRQSDKQLLRQKMGLPVDKFIVIGAGQVQTRKGIRDLIKIAERNPNEYFLWVGGVPFKNLGADYGEMKKIMEADYPNLKFTGIVDLKDMASYYALSDAFLLPSTQETFGLVVIEAAACGLPILLRNISDYDYTFKDYALLANDVNDFSVKITNLKTNQAVYQKYTRLAAKLADRYDSAKIAQKTLTVYEQLLKPKS